MTAPLTQAPPQDLLALYWQTREVIGHSASCDCCWCQLLDRAHRMATQEGAEETQQRVPLRLPS